MKKSIQRSLAAALCLICGLGVYAHDFEVNGIYYNFGAGNTAQVTYQGGSSSAFVGEYVGDIVIPDMVTFAGTTYTVSSIGENAFYDCPGVTSIIVGNNVTTIDDDAFGKCTGLTSLTLGKNVTTITGVFYKCNALSEITSYATTPPAVGYVEFRDLYLKAIYVPNELYDTYKANSNWGVRNIIKLEPEIGDIFSSNQYKYRVTDNIGNNIALIGTSIDASKLDTLSIAESVTFKVGTYRVTSVGDSAFYNYTKLCSVFIPQSITLIGKSAFEKCTLLESVDIPGSVTTIGEYAFNNNKYLTAVTLGSGITSIGEYAFADNGRIESVICHATTPPAIKSSTFFGVTQVPLIVPAGCKGAYQSASYWRSFATILESGESLPVGTKLKVNDIYYKVTNAEDKTVEVTFKGENINEYQNWYTDSLVIPDNITYGGTTYSVTAIGEQAFYGCSYLNSLTIGANVAEVNLNAFYNCYYLNDIVVDSDNKVFDSRDNCNAIVETATNTIVIGAVNTKIPASITAIGESAFQYRYLQSITIPSNITHIGKRAFYLCNLLENVYITDIAVWCNITFEDSNANPLHIADKLYLNNELMTELVIPDNVTSIGNYAFYNYDGLTYIDFGNNVTTIGKSAFSNCDGFANITIPVGVTSIGESAFYLCAGLRTVYYNAENCTVASFSAPAFTRCENFQQLIIGDSVKIIPDNAFAECAALTNVVMGKSVTNIGAWSFYECTSLQDVTLSNSVKIIGLKAFSGCNSLKSIVITDSVETIESGAFYGCYNLTDCTIGSSVKDIQKSAFEGCKGLKNLVIADGDSTLNIEAISYAAFGGSGQGMFNQSPLETLYIGRNVTYRTDGGYSPFYNRKELTKVTIGDKVTTLPDYLLYECSNFASIHIPASVTSISSSAFHHCSGLETITVEAGNTVYDSRNNCNSVIISESDKLMIGSSNSVIPQDVKEILPYAFYGRKLTQIAIPDGVEVIGAEAFGRCATLGNVSFGTGLKTINENAFCECVGLTEITIPNNVEYIGRDVFSGCTGITEVTLGTAVETIGDYAFSNCSALSKITCYAIEPPACAGWTFVGIDTSIPVYVLEESIDAYKNALGWSNFTNFQALPKEGTVAAPVINISGRVVTITCETEEASIYYTLDGTEPTTESDLYTEPIRLKSNCVVRAMAAKTNYYSSVAADAEASNIINLTFAQESARMEYSGEKYTPEIIVSGDMDSAAALQYVTAYRVEDEEETLADANNLVDAGYYRLALTADDDNVYAQEEMYLYIKKAYMTIAPDYAERKYGEENPSFTYKIYGLVNDETESVLLTKPSITTTATPTSDVGEYPITADGAFAVNYDIIYWEATLTIAKAPLTITAEDKTIEYGEALPEFTFVAEGFYGDDTIGNIDELPTISCDVSETTLSGTYPIILTGGNDNNYELVLINGILTINEPPVVMAESIALSSDLIELSEGQSEQLVAIITPDNVTETTVAWSSSNENIATVDAQGVVEAVSQGEAVITATTIDGSGLSAQCTIIVLQASIGNTQEDNTLITTIDGDIIIKNAPQGSVVYLYTTAGTLISNTQVTDIITRISMNIEGVYIVKVDNTVKKIVL